LLALIHSRAKAGDVNTVSKERSKPARAPKTAKVVDLVALLSQSMQEKSPGRGHKKAAHSAARAKPAHHKRAASSKHAPAHRKSA